jgi:hypothetical protein
VAEKTTTLEMVVTSVAVDSLDVTGFGGEPVSVVAGHSISVQARAGEATLSFKSFLDVAPRIGDRITAVVTRKVHDDG